VVDYEMIGEDRVLVRAVDDYLADYAVQLSALTSSTVEQEAAHRLLLDMTVVDMLFKQDPYDRAMMYMVDYNKPVLERILVDVSSHRILGRGETAFPKSYSIDAEGLDKLKRSAQGLGANIYLVYNHSKLIGKNFIEDHVLDGLHAAYCKRLSIPLPEQPVNA
jgi:hypothetical protein